ncbi:metal dependent hydrolase [Deferribacter desulfuricans SSM1]|uniref:UPF0173 metal-dependent hydrolase DEFDS_0010 n=1 Tax=Deferribacter desulfuricans (strain DSM 14783 / JCM 11476 / NBRC 101012 / SSM1) TaxID=639282 RepID=D3PA99_DEFDS|nr:metal-dependent hydrolase [Deferribacter desulfuricans]BAI79522.1 metal dependent hydrolase [Deferribacter desulfuricans SSM1]
MATIKWLGHAAVLIKGSKNILIDPFIKGNPVAKVNIDEIDVDLILVTHGHPDHLGDTIEISKKKNIPVIAIFEITNYLQSKGINDIIPMNIGGKRSFDFGWVKMVPALHSSSIIDAEGIHYAGNPVGYVVNIDGSTIYVAGDTALFKDMEIIGELLKPDIAILPVGDNFTMDIDEAIYACKLLKVKKMIPIHYNTWDLISIDIEKFKKDCADKGVETIILEVNGEYEI